MIIGGIFGYKYYKIIFQPNTQIADNSAKAIYIPTKADYGDVLNLLVENNIIIDKQSFDWVARKKNYPANIKPGKYTINPTMNNNALVNLLRSGRQTPVKLTFNNIRTKQQFAGIIARQIEADSLSIIKLLENDTFTSVSGFTSENIMTLFIPNTYEFYWNTSASEFISRMNKEYDKFWNDSRRKKSKKAGLSIMEVSILASIVQAEQSRHNDEKAKVAGLYINRLNKNMALQADPTLIFALGDFSIKRVLDRDKEIESPYNTYKNTGLPPGPINLPEISSIDAVLNYEKHNYYFMCVRDDFSGYHNFSVSLAQHNRYAALYHNALNKRKIHR